MINPSRVHRAKGVVTNIREHDLMITVEHNGHLINGYLDHCGKRLKDFKVGDLVNIQCSYSIMGEQYMIRTINKPRKR